MAWKKVWKSDYQIWFEIILQEKLMISRKAGKRSVPIVMERKDSLKHIWRREVAFSTPTFTISVVMWDLQSTSICVLLPHLTVHQIWMKCEDIYSVFKWRTCKFSLIWILFSIFCISFFFKNTPLAVLRCWIFYYLMKCVQLEKRNHSAFEIGRYTSLKRVL